MAYFLSILHLTWKHLFALLNVQMHLDSRVSFGFLWIRKDDVWFLYRSLKLVASPTYVSVVVLLGRVAWYTMLFVTALYFEGALFFLSPVSFFDVFERTALLCDAMMDFM